MRIIIGNVAQSFVDLLLWLNKKIELYSSDMLTNALVVHSVSSYLVFQTRMPYHFFLYHRAWRGSRIMDYRSTKLRHCPGSSSDWSSQKLYPVRDILYTLGPYWGVNTLFSSGPYLQPKASCHTSPHICQRYRFQEQMSPRAKTLLPINMQTLLEYKLNSWHDQFFYSQMCLTSCSGFNNKLII
jgi:hypothetical protein